MNHFDFYGFPVAFQVDEKALRRLYLEHSRKYHPDFHTLSDEAEQAHVLDLSTRNNEAFKTLSDEDKRIQYVLKIKGLIEEGEGQGVLPQEFLMDMMDINEAMMELEFDFDAGRLEETRRSVEALDQALREGIQPVLDTWTEAQGSEADLLRARDYFFKKRYLLRIFENLSKFAPA
ncbi:MAG: Fe-S protein assembly co-chaperone HscB [Saprospiraceae bacterium]|nr:Fe-S protein assembly co-chaperone HscB [Saprospiraceae bacterium]